MVEQWLIDLMKKYFIVSWCENDGGLYPGCPMGGSRERNIPGVLKRSQSDSTCILDAEAHA